VDSNGINDSEPMIYVILSEKETANVIAEVVRKAFSPPYEFPPLPPEDV